MLSKFHLLLVWAMIAAVPVVAACRQFGPESDGASRSSKLVENGSFESEDGQPTLAGWRVQSPMLTSLVEEAPAGGGRWSLKLEADGAPTMGNVSAVIPGVQDGDILRLSAQARATSSNGGAVIGLVVGPGVEPGQRRQARFASTTGMLWSALSVQATVSVGEGDAVWILLSSPITEMAARSGLFDLITVERLPK